MSAGLFPLMKREKNKTKRGKKMSKGLSGGREKKFF